MKISERLDKIADGLQAQRDELRRLGIDLPYGRTLDEVECVYTHLRIDIESLRAMAAQLRKWNA